MIKRALIIDDDKDFREFTSIVLNGEGWETEELSGSEGVLEKLREKEFSLVISDLMMENHDSGFVLAYRISKEFPELPVVIATSMVKQTGLTLGKNTSWLKAERVLHKPLSVKALSDILKDVENH